MKYSVFTVMTPEYELAEAVALLAELGFDGVECRVQDIPPELWEEPPSYWRNNRSTIPLTDIEARAGEVRALTEGAGLELCALSTYLGVHQIDDVRRVLHAAAEMGCPQIRLMSPCYDGSTPYAKLYGEAVAGLADLERAARESGVKVNLEIHMTYITPSAALAYRLVSHFDPRYIGVIYDPGNMVREGYEAWRLGLELLGAYVSHVHVKNAAWEPAGQEEDGTQRWEAREAPLWKGLVNWRQVLAELRVAGYEGYLSLEDFSTAQPTRQKLAADLAYLKRLEEGTGG